MAAVNRETVAKRYAQAVFDIAVEDGNVSAWRDTLASFTSLFGEVDVARVMDDGRVPDEEKLAFVQAALPGLDAQATNVARLLVTRGRTSLAPLIAAQYGALADEHEGIIRATVTSALELSPEQREEIVQRLSQSTGRTVTLETQVDPQILGGLIVRVGDQLVDGSVRTRLQRLRRRLVGAA